MTRKSGKHCAQHAKPLDSCFNLIKSHQQCISAYLQSPWEDVAVEVTASSVRVRM